MRNLISISLASISIIGCIIFFNWVMCVQGVIFFFFFYSSRGQQNYCVGALSVGG